jgi:hypothetical protein
MHSTQPLTDTARHASNAHTHRNTQLNNIGESLQQAISHQQWVSHISLPCPSLPSLQAQHQQTLQGKFMLQMDEAVNIAAGFRDRSVHHSIAYHSTTPKNNPMKHVPHVLTISQPACVCMALGHVACEHAAGLISALLLLLTLLVGLLLPLQVPAARWTPQVPEAAADRW